MRFSLVWIIFPSVLKYICFEIVYFIIVLNLSILKYTLIKQHFKHILNSFSIYFKMCVCFIRFKIESFLYIPY